MDKPVVPLTYEQLGHWIESLQPALIAEEFDLVVGILRGGAPLALMVSDATGAGVAFLRYDRATREVRWDSTLPLPEPGSKVLLCEDIAGRGQTLVDCIAFLSEHGLVVRTLTGAFDDLSRLRPDYSIDASSYFALFPSEREAYTDRYRAGWIHERDGARMDGDHEYAVYAIDLDGVLPPDMPIARYDEDLGDERDERVPFERLPGIDMKRTRAIITARPEIDRERTLAWLERHGFGHLELIMRTPDERDDTAAAVAAHKAAAAIRSGVTHFIESDPVQAILIAQSAPLLRVIWWNAQTRTGTLIGASAWR